MAAPVSAWERIGELYLWGFFFLRPAPQGDTFFYHSPCACPRFEPEAWGPQGLSSVGLAGGVVGVAGRAGLYSFPALLVCAAGERW